MKKIFTTALLIGSSLSLLAGGYKVSLQGVRQAGMGHTSTSFTQDASGIFFNPAMISFSEYSGGFGGSFFSITGTNYYQNPKTGESYETDNPTGTPLQFGGFYTFNNGLTIALNACTPYGNTIKWPTGWTGRDMVTDISLTAIYIQPTIAYKFNDWLSIGASYNIVSGALELNRDITGVGGDMSLTGDARGQGFTVGLYGQPTPNMRWGLSYRSKVDMKAENQKASFGIPQSVISASGPFVTNEDKFTATLPLVSEWTTGVTYKFSDKFQLSGELNMAQWSQYESLDIDFEQNSIGNDPDDMTISSTPKKFFNVGTIRVGGQYDFSDKLCMRLGYYHDPSPVKSKYWSPETPSTDINAATVGLGFRVSDHLDIDLAGMFLGGKETYINNTMTNFSGDVKSDANIFGISIAYNFKKKIINDVYEVQ